MIFKEEIFQLGDLIVVSGMTKLLVVKTDSYSHTKYGLLDLESNSVLNWFDSLKYLKEYWFGKYGWYAGFGYKIYKASNLILTTN